MRNLELKARYADLAHAEQIAQDIGATFGGDLRQLDTYFNVPRGRLKLREFLPALRSGGGPGAETELIYYARLEDSATRWSDYFTAHVAEASVMRNVLTHVLGIRCQIEKSRRLYLYRGARIHLDRVMQLGTFIEFEVPLAPLSDLPRDAGEATRAHEVMRELMRVYGLNDEDAIKASYSEMIEERLQ